MQVHRPLRNHIEKYRKAAQDLRVWVLQVFAWWIGVFGDRGSRLYLQQCIRDARQEARALIFLSMIARMNVRHRTSGVMRPPPLRRGFRYKRRRFRPIHIFTRGVALKTLADIRAALDAFDDVVERALAKLPKSRVTGQLLVRSVGDLAHVTSSTAYADEVVRAPDTS